MIRTPIHRFFSWLWGISPVAFFGLVLALSILLLALLGLTIAVGLRLALGKDQADRGGLRGLLRSFLPFLPHRLRDPAIRALGLALALAAMGVFGRVSGLPESAKTGAEASARSRGRLAERVRDYGGRLVAHARAVGSPFHYALEGERIVVTDATGTRYPRELRAFALEDRPLDQAVLELEAEVRARRAVPIPEAPRSRTLDADLLLEQARARWEAGDIDRSILAAELALLDLEFKLPADHEAIARVRAMIDSARRSRDRARAPDVAPPMS